MEKIICFFFLFVNFNNHSPAVGNDSQNGFNCSRWATIIHELTKDIVTNNIVAQLYFYYHGRLSTLMHAIKPMTEKNAPTSLTFSMAMRYGAKRIAQYSRSRVTRDAAGRRHQVSIRA